MPRSSGGRRNRANTFSGLPSDVEKSLKEAKKAADVPVSPEEVDSSAGESSPETPGEASDNYSNNNNNIINNNNSSSSSSNNNHNKNGHDYKSSSKKKREKKNRQPRIIMSPPPDASIPVFFEDDIRHRDGGVSKKLSYEHDFKGNALGTARIEKSSSFKRKTKPPGLEGLMSRELDIPTGKKSSGKVDSRNNNNSNNNNHDAGRQVEYNIVLLGDLGVGKTALAVRFVTRRYLHEYDSTLERTYEKSIQYSAGQARIRLWDTVNKSFETFTENADGFIVLYSTTSSQTARNAQNTIKSIKSSKHAAVRIIPIMLVGTKCELEHAREVKRDDQETFARHHDCCFREISVACTINIDSIIKTLVEEIHITDRGRLDKNGHPKLTASSSLIRKPSGTKKHIMKNFMMSKKKEKERV